MKKSFMTALVTVLMLAFSVSCGGAKKITPDEPEQPADSDTVEETDTEPADNDPVTQPDNEPSEQPADNEPADADPVVLPDDDYSDPQPPEPVGEVEFERITADNNPYNPAFVTVDDLDSDGFKDMIVCQYGPVTNISMKGRIDIYWGTGDLATWTREELNIGGDIKYPHPVKVADINGDGIKDIIVPGGFLACATLSGCGVLFWLEGTAERNQWIRHDIVSMGYDHFFFDVTLADLDGDGIDDLITNGSKKPTIGKQDERLMWFKGTNTPERFDNNPRIIADGFGGPFPRITDLNSDGRPDIAIAQYFNDDPSKNGSFLWFEQTNDINNWTRHIIDNESGTSFMIEIIDNLYGDGVRRAVGVNHVNTTDKPNGPQEGVFIFDIPADPTQPWPKINIATDIKSRKSPLTGPQAAPGLFGYGDITGNGLIDLVVSGDGDSRVFWFEQNPAGTFTQHTLDGIAGATINSTGSFGQAGGMKIVDLDNDGRNEIIVTLYEDNKLYIYKVR
ncbi:VCBS repeat-containing protein [bacterium]|nr:VCBS repeat-containing protein [bacterium]